MNEKFKALREVMKPKVYPGAFRSSLQPAVQYTDFRREEKERILEVQMFQER